MEHKARRPHGDVSTHKLRAGAICILESHPLASSSSSALFPDIQDARILLISSQSYPDRWILPAGTVEAGETMLQSALREVQEEAGVLVESYDKCQSFLGNVIDESKNTTTAWFLFKIDRLIQPGEKDEHGSPLWQEESIRKRELKSFSDAAECTSWKSDSKQVLGLLVSFFSKDEQSSDIS